MIAGDIYDRSAPSGDAVALLDNMLTTLADMGITLMLVAGNHDSGQRLSFGGSLLAKQNVYIAGVLAPEMTHVTLHDEYEPVTFWLMPYVFPALVAKKFDDSSITDYNSAVRRLLAAQKIDFSQRNVLVAHQNVVADGQEALRGGSESMVGGVGQIDFHIFDGFDYVALGHIHSAYQVGRPTIRYAGSPLCYHFEETKQAKKGPVLVSLAAKDTAPTIQTMEIPPLHPMREIKGAYNDIQANELNIMRRGEYVRVVLTDQRVTPEISQFLHSFFANRDSILMELVSEYNQYGAVAEVQTAAANAEKSLDELFVNFYTERYGDVEPDQAELELLQFVGEQVCRSHDGDSSIEAREINDLLQFALKQGVKQ